MKTKKELKAELKKLQQIAQNLEELMNDEYYKEKYETMHDEITNDCMSIESTIDDLENE